MPAKGHDLPKADPATQRELAARLRISVQSLSGWSKLPGAPTDYNVAAWKAFVEENQLGLSGNRVSKSRETLLTEQVEKKNRLLDIDIAKKEGRLAPVESINEGAMRTASAQKQMLYQILVHELPPRTVGQDVATVRQLNQDTADRICELMRGQKDAIEASIREHDAIEAIAGQAV